MQQAKILEKVTLKQNHKGTYYVELTQGQATVQAYLPKKSVEAQLFYSPLILDKTYLASAYRISSGKAFVEQLVAVAEDYDADDPLKLHCECRLLSDGRVALQEVKSRQQLCLSKQIVRPFKHRIFQNSRVSVVIAHSATGFCIESWHTQEPANLERGLLRDIYALENGQYSGRYYVTDNSYVSVQFWPSDYEKYGIRQVTDSAVLPVHITFDGAKKPVEIRLLQPEKLLDKYNTPHTQLTYLGVKNLTLGKSIHQFATPLIDGISVLVSAWESELEYCVEDISGLQVKQRITSPISAKPEVGRCNFKPAISGELDYHEKFRCITLKEIGAESFALLETLSLPCQRVLLPRAELIKHGVYAIAPDVVLQLEMTRSSASVAWQLVQIDYSVLQAEIAEPIECHVLSNWGRYNKPDYLIQLQRDRKNYAFTNHALATFWTAQVQLLVLIPVAVLVEQGFRKLKTQQNLQVQVKSITYPVFESTPRPILCVEQVLDTAEQDVLVADERYVNARFLEALPDHKSGKSQYRFAIVDSDKTADFIDRKAQLSQIVDLSKYTYHLCITEFYTRLYVQELISASLI